MSRKQVITAVPERPPISRGNHDFMNHATAGDASRKEERSKHYPYLLALPAYL
jgi:hypothetical protein